jgi:hypothetical protein
MFFVAYRRPVVFWFPLSNEIFYNNVFQLLKEGQLYAGFLLAMKSSIKIMFYRNFIAKRKPEYNWPSVSN